MPEARARLERWLDTEPAAPLSVRTKKRYIVLHMASRLSEQTGATVPEALERLLAKLEGEQARLPSTNQYGFLKANAEHLTI